MSPINARDAVRHNISTIGLIPADNVAVLLGRLAKVTKHEVPFEP
ncbi:MAG TPA: hypothetical protein VEF35_10485 [Candidatus Bathyarchaeia archaeon]|nr:hypothetical protein [Candidatus Bathyarchaeia archaeon]